MTINREDVFRMKSTAEKILQAKSAFEVHTIEHDFVSMMSERYGKSKAVDMLSKVWNLASIMKIMPENTNFELIDTKD